MYQSFHLALLADRSLSPTARKEAAGGGEIAKGNYGKLLPEENPGTEDTTTQVQAQGGAMDPTSSLFPNLVVSRRVVLAEDDGNKPRANMSPSIVQVAEGEFLVAWAAGTDENAPDVAVLISRYSSGKWSTPVEAVMPLSRNFLVCGHHFSPPESCKGQNSTWNPVLFSMREGKLLLFYQVGISRSASRRWIVQSSDSGVSWGAPTELPLRGTMTHPPVLLPGGVIVVASSTFSDNPKHPHQCWVDVSLDEGATWDRRGPVVHTHSLSNPAAWLGDDMAVHLLAWTPFPQKMMVEGMTGEEYVFAKGFIHFISDATGEPPGKLSGLQVAW